MTEYSGNQGEVAINLYQNHICKCVHEAHTHTHILIYLFFLIDFSCVFVILLCRMKFPEDFTLNLFLSPQYLAQALEYGRFLIQRS